MISFEQLIVVEILMGLEMTEIRKSKSAGGRATVSLGVQYSRKQTMFPPVSNELFFAQDKILKDCEKILNFYSKDLIGQDDLLLRLQTALKSHTANLKSLIQLFDFPPYPSLESFLEKLESPFDIKIFINAFELDPKSGRADTINKQGLDGKSAISKIKEQFSALHIDSIIKEIQSVLAEDALSEQEQYELVQQITYINSIGKDYPLITDLDPHGVYKDLTQCSRQTLNRLSNLFIAAIRSPSSENELLKNQLKLLAVLREQYFRATGVFPNIRQLATVLMSLKNQSHNMLMEMDTEQDKGVTAALLSVMQWVVVDGGTVDVCTISRELLDGDYNINGVKDFFSLVSTKINSSLIKADSPGGTYQVGGINYSTLGDLALYRSRASIENESLTPKQHTVSSLIIDRYDLSVIQKQNVFQSFQSSEEGPEPEISAGMLYSLINQFIDSEQFKNTDPITAWNKAQDIVHFKVFLNDNIENSAYLNDLSDEQFNEWIELALYAKQLAEGVDFYITEGDDSIHLATPLHSNEPQQGFIFSKGVQQLLHARLQKLHEDKGWIFPVEPTMPILDSASIVHLINQYQTGRTIGLCSILDKQEELIEQSNMDVIYRLIPTEIKPKSQEKVIEFHYKQSAFAMQQVVLRQFDEWYAFLHLLFPLSERAELNQYLLEQRHNLQVCLKEAWEQSLYVLATSTLDFNPFVLRDSDGKLKTQALDDALATYELTINELWESQSATLKTKAEGKIDAGSVNEQRFNYIAAISLHDQLEFDKLQIRKNRQKLLQQHKRNQRYLVSALDANAAMLQYSDGILDEYRDKFEKTQVELFQQELLRIVKTNLFLSKSTKNDLLHHIKTAAWDITSIVLFLNSYAKKTYLSSHNMFNKKYFIQPLVQDVLYVYEQLKYPDTQELNELRDIYFNNVLVELVDELETTLSWAIKGNRGLGYLLERSAVVKAANDILRELEGCKNNPDPYARKIAIKNLYKALMLHQDKLKDLWIFSFGHKNTRTLINNTLATLDKLDVVSGKMNADFLQECKNNALYYVMNEQFYTAFKKINSKMAKVKFKQEDAAIAWDQIKEKITLILEDSQDLYVFHEIRFFLNELINIHPELMPAMIQLREHLRDIELKFQEKNPTLIDENKYFALKIEKLSKIFRGSSRNIQIKAINNGVSTYYDLIVEANNSNPLFNHLSPYQSQLMIKLKTQSAALDAKMIGIKSEIIELQKLKSLLTSTEQVIDLLKFPEHLRAKADEINILNGYVGGQYPDNLERFTAALQDAFNDRVLVKTFDLENLTSKQISGIKNKTLLEKFTSFYRSVHTSPNALQKLLSYAASWVQASENLQDEFIQLVNQPQHQITDFLMPAIDKKRSILVSEVQDFIGQLEKQVSTLVENESFLLKKKREEQIKGKTYFKRFMSMSELQEFETKLSQEFFINVVQDSDDPDNECPFSL